MNCPVHLGARVPCSFCVAWHEDARTAPLTVGPNKAKRASGERGGRITSAVHGARLGAAMPASDRKTAVRARDGGRA